MNDVRKGGKNLSVSLGREEMGLHMRGSFCANLWTASGLEEYQVPRDTGTVIGAKRSER